MDSNKCLMNISLKYGFGVNSQFAENEPIPEKALVSFTLFTNIAVLRLTNSN